MNKQTKNEINLKHFQRELMKLSLHKRSSFLYTCDEFLGKYIDYI